MVRGIAWLILTPALAFGQLKTAPEWMDHMVLQRGKSLTIEGKAIPGQTVHITFSGQKHTASTAGDSSWRIQLRPLPANAKPGDMLITAGKERIKLRDLLVGDVWLCLGQSNMEFSMSGEAHFTSLQPFVDRTLVRQYNPRYIGKGIYGTAFPDSMVRLIDSGIFYTGAWERCDSTSIRSMSAVAFYFAEQVTKRTGVPIGLVHLAIGGAPLETFIPKEALAADPTFTHKVRGNWLQNMHLPNWARERGRQNRGDDSGDAGPAHGYNPGFAFDKGLRRLTGNPVAGILFYQGETNAQEEARVEEYGRLFRVMVEAYRHYWPGAPCYFVQLSSIDSTKYRSQLWPAFRDGQRRILQDIPHTGMAVSSDIGALHDVHPANKKTVGERLAAWALHDYYGFADVPSGPLVQKAAYVAGKVIIHFNWAEGLQPAGSALLKGFSLDGVHPATAIIRGNRVEITTPERPAFVYYGWQPFTDANLQNTTGLPASTFRLRIEP